MRILTESSITCLTAAGWHDGRCIDTNAFEAMNRDCGFFVSQAAISFLQEFGLLRLEYPHFRVPSTMDWCHFNALRAAGNAIPEAIQEYEIAVGQPLSVIGEAFTNHMTLCMDELGRVYGGFEDTLVKFGESGEDAINCFCEGREGVSVDVPNLELPPGSDNISLSDTAYLALIQAGWKETDAGSVVGSRTEAFLARFGGISFEYQTRQHNVDICQIGPACVPTHYIHECQQRLRQVLTPIAELQGLNGVLLMDHEGRVFGGVRETSDILWFIGVSGTDAINKLVAGEVTHRPL